MTVESSPRREHRFVRDGLPWLVGAAALALYLTTLDRWVTLDSLALVARVSGWEWQPALSQPVLFLLTCPFRWLPTDWVPLALNASAAFCASLTLVVLARSVALLPYVRLKGQRLLVQNDHPLLSLPDAWVPVALATVALGLQMTFLEHAIAASGEMLDLLLFAYVIRCLLEHQVRGQPFWLDRAALTLGVAMANNWAMLGFLPLFLVALLRAKRLSFFSLRALRRLARSRMKGAASALAADSRFLLRMALLGLAGLSLLLVLPLVQALSPDSPLNFWQAVRATAGFYKAPVHVFVGTFTHHHRDVALLLAAVCLLPVLVLLSIRWRAFASVEKQVRFGLPAFILHASHAFLLLLCLWVVFDPPFSPRQIGRQIGLPLPFLPLYYLAALGIGYCSGFFLLFFGADALQRPGWVHPLRRALGRAAPKAAGILVGLTLAGLLLKNHPTIRASSAPHLEHYIRLAAGSLPPEGAIVLSYDPARLTLLQAALVREGKAGRYVLVDVHNLPFTAYRGWLGRKYPGRWPAAGAEAKAAGAGRAASGTHAPLDAVGLVQLVSRLAQSNRVYCLHPSFGLLHEQFCLQPHGLLQEMKFYPPNSFGGPPLTSTELAENQAFWQRAIETGVNPVLQLVAPLPALAPNFQQRLMRLAHLQTFPPDPAQALAQWYSGALNDWGVTLQQDGRPGEATSCFALAAALNADNLPARVNLLCNSNLLARQTMSVVRAQSFQDQFDKYRNWNQLLSENGPFDEPSYCYQLGLSFAGTGLLRQAGRELERVKALAPGDLIARLLLGDLCNRCLMPDRALQVVAGIRADAGLQPLTWTNAVEVALLEASAWYAKTNRSRAEGIIYSLLSAHAGDPALLERAGAAFTAHHSYSNALSIAGQQLQSAPDNVAALVNQGSLCLLMGDFSNAIPPLTRALSLTNTYAARLNRAFAYLRTGRLEAAEADYQDLLRAFPNAYRAYHGLGEIAWQKRDTNVAIRYYQQYLARAAADSEEGKFVAARLKSLQEGRH